MNAKKEIGNRGEDAVCQFLTEQGHTILERNWRSSHREVDIISLADDGIHFVEVKSRTAPVMAEPEENVRADKKRNIAGAAAHYLALKQDTLPEGVEAWLDVATVVFDGESETVTYYPAAYVPVYYQ